MGVTSVKKHVAEITKERSRRLRHEMTEAERKLWSVLSRRQMNDLKFRRQVPFGPYIADFVSHEAKLVIELDGGQHAESASDVARTAFLNREGYRVLRFWNNEVLENPDGVHAVIVEKIGELRHAARA